MEQELDGLLAQVRRAANALGSRVLLTGILPTMRQSDLSLEAMTPNPRYAQINRALVDLAAHLMDWEHLRHVLVVDETRKLLGIVTEADFIDAAARLLEEQLRDHAPRS